MRKPVRILSLDGGGTWAIIQAMALGRLYGPDTPGRTILRQFDFAFANSGGSIVLGGLMIDKTPQQLVDSFLDPAQRRALFTPLPWYSIWHWTNKFVGLGPKYETEPKREALKARGLDKPLCTVKHHDGHQTYIVIIAFDYDRERAFFFRSKPSMRTQAAEMNLADAIHASSTAPINFFRHPATAAVKIAPSTVAEVLHFWDGALAGINNPVAAAVTEAMSVGKNPQDIAVLSIGTANNILPNNRIDQTASHDFVIRPGSDGVIAGLMKLATAVVNDPPDLASFLAHVALGGQTPSADDSVGTEQGSVVRMNPAITPRWTGTRWDAPEGLTVDELERLIKLQMDATRAEDVALIEKLANKWMDDKVFNQPIRLNFREPTQGMVAEIGHLTFSQSLDLWRSMAPEGLV